MTSSLVQGESVSFMLTLLLIEPVCFTPCLRKSVQGTWNSSFLSMVSSPRTQFCPSWHPHLIGCHLPCSWTPSSSVVPLHLPSATLWHQEIDVTRNHSEYPSSAMYLKLLFHFSLIILITAALREPWKPWEMWLYLSMNGRGGWSA